MPVTFQPVTVNQRHLGFDTSTTPKEILCRLGETRLVAVTFDNPEQNIQVVSQNPAIAKVVDRLDSPPEVTWVEIHGMRAGETTIQARLNGVVTDTLRVVVYKHRTVKVNFYRVQGTTFEDIPDFSLSQAKSVLSVVNALYKYQANITFLTHLLREVSLDDGVDVNTAEGGVGEETSVANWMVRAAHKRDTSASHLNIFCVKTWAVRDRWEEELGIWRDVHGTTYGNCIIAEDVGNLSYFSQIIAHELGHALQYLRGSGTETHSEKPLALMRKKIEPANLNLYPSDVALMRGGPI